MALIDDAQTWHGARQNTDWTGLPLEQRNAALLKAQDYVLAANIRTTLTQAEQVRRDTAIFMLAREFAINPPVLRQANNIKSLKEEVGPVVEETTYFAVSDDYPEIARLLAPLIVGSSAGFRVTKLTPYPRDWSFDA